MIKPPAKGLRQPGEQMNPSDVPVCVTCGAVAPCSFAEKPTGQDMGPPLGFVPDKDQPLDKWTFEHKIGAYVCPDCPKERFEPDPDAAKANAQTEA